MKNKSLKKILCFLLALVVIVSMPLNLHASALAIESWVIWAIVTYLTSVGLIFTATGGAQAVYDAVEEKVNQYGDNVIDFYDIVRGNLRIVKPPNLPPNWNPDFGNLFITAVGVEALGKFAEWLTSEGGWSGTINQTTNTGTFTMNVNGVDTVCSTSNGLTLVNEYLYDVEQIGVYAKLPKLYSELAEDEYLIPHSYITYTTNRDFVSTFYGVMKNEYTSNTYKSVYWKYGSSVGAQDSFNLLSRLSAYFPDNPLDHVLGITLAYLDDGNPLTTSDYNWFLVLDNNQLLYMFDTNASTIPKDFVPFTSSALIEIPTELPEIKPLPTLEGLLLESESLAADSLEALGDVVETYFNDSGTIPVPQPNIVPDPEATPVPTPVPTPAPSPEIEDVGDLGLPSLGEAIFSKFPFSIPKDLKRISDILNAEPVTPKWEVDLFEPLDDKIAFRGDTEFTIDLEEYEELGQISRWASVISFVVFLILITRGVIRW